MAQFSGGHGIRGVGGAVLGVLLYLKKTRERMVAQYLGGHGIQGERYLGFYCI